MIAGRLELPSKDKPGTKRVGAGGALYKPVTLSPQLEAVVGKGPMTRAEVTSKVWDHIKKNSLQDKSDKRMINPDLKLGEITGSQKISMFKLTAEVAKHLK